MRRGQLLTRGPAAALPPVPHSWVLLQGGAQSCDLLCQALQYRILHLSLVGAVEALERVSRIQRIHLRRRENIHTVCIQERRTVSIVSSPEASLQNTFTLHVF